MSGDTVMKVENLVITAGADARPVIRDISLTVAPGEVLALIGASGSGKTTLALTALGLLRPGLSHAGGKVTVAGHDMLRADPHTLRQLRGRAVAYVAQSAAAAFNPRMRLDDQVIEPSLVHGTLASDRARMRAHATYAELGLPMPQVLGRRFPHQVSGGQLQRFMIAMGLQEIPQLLVCDEPTSALDVTTQVEVLTALKTGIRVKQSAALFVSHDLAVVAQIADRVAVLRQGQIVEIGATEQILNAPRADYTRELLGAYRGFDAVKTRAATSSRTPAEQHGQPSGAPLLDVSNVHVGYGTTHDGKPRVTALRDISLQLRRGEILSVIGESGSGKSTLARAIAGLQPPYAGHVALAGGNLAAGITQRGIEERRRIQMVFQSADTSLNARHTVRKILGRVLDFFGRVKGHAREARIAELLDLVRLPADYANKRASQMSGGEKQRVNLARALAANPDVLICDEITSALDNVVADAILGLIDELRQRLGLAVIFVSHDLAAVAAFSDQVLVLRHGVAVEQGTVEQVLRTPGHAYTQLLTASVPELRTSWLEDTVDRYRSLREALRLSESVQPNPG